MKFFRVVRKTVYESDFDDQRGHPSGTTEDFVLREDLYVSDMMKMQNSDQGTRTEVKVVGFFGMYERTLLRYYRLVLRDTGKLKFILAYQKTRPSKGSMELVERPV